LTVWRPSAVQGVDLGPVVLLCQTLLVLRWSRSS
jgi:hypothetical protein